MQKELEITSEMEVALHFRLFTLFNAVSLFIQFKLHNTANSCRYAYIYWERLERYIGMEH